MTPIPKTLRRRGVRKFPMPKTIPNARNITGPMIKTGKVPKIKMPKFY